MKTQFIKAVDVHNNEYHININHIVKFNATETKILIYVNEGEDLIYYSFKSTLSDFLLLLETSQE